MDEERILLGCRLVRTCDACPEQYDVYFDGRKIGYLRLRWGGFTAQHPGPGGMVVFEASPRGYGIFEDGEREDYLKSAVSALLARDGSLHEDI
jgi:hypothetical protein